MLVQRIIRDEVLKESIRGEKRKCKRRQGIELLPLEWGLEFH